MARVLVVEDDPAVGSVVEQIMVLCGHEALSAAGGFPALKTLSQEPVDLVITDIVMPDMTGVKLIDEIRRLYPKVKILAISGGGPRYGPDTCLELAREHGADRWLMKPIIMNELSAITDELLAEPRRYPPL